MKYAVSLLMLPLAGCVIADVTDVSPRPAAIGRQYASATAFYAKNIVIPPGYETIRLPGIISDYEGMRDLHRLDFLQRMDFLILVV